MPQNSLKLELLKSMKSLKLTSGGKLTEAFNDLISCDFIRKYNAFGNKNMPLVWVACTLWSASVTVVTSA